jgi:hypothetical protein
MYMGTGAKVLTVGLFCARRIFAKTRKSVKFHNIFWILLLLTGHVLKIGRDGARTANLQCGLIESPMNHGVVDINIRMACQSHEWIQRALRAAPQGIRLANWQIKKAMRQIQSIGQE